MVYAIQDIALPVIILDLIGIFLILFKERYDPRSFILWLMILIFLPVFGFLAYLMWGCTLFEKHRFNRKYLSDRELLGPVTAEGSLIPVCEAGTDIISEGNATFLVTSDIEDHAIQDIRGAEKSIDLECGVLSRGRISRELADAANRGVRVRILTGTYGFGRIAGVRDVVSAGGCSIPFDSILHAAFSVKNRARLGRRFMVIDDSVSYMDSGIRLEGPVSSRLGYRFEADWIYSSGDVPVEHATSAPAGDCAVQVVSGGPDCPEGSPVQSMYQFMASSSAETIIIATPFLVPDEEFHRILKLMSLSGTQVSMVFPRHGIRWYQYRNTMTAAKSLLECGVKVYFTEEDVRSTMVVSDGHLCATSPLPLSMVMMDSDFSINLVVESEDLSGSIVESIGDMMGSSNEYTLECYESRTIWDRVVFFTARMFMFMN